MDDCVGYLTAYRRKGSIVKRAEQRSYVNVDKGECQGAHVDVFVDCHACAESGLELGSVRAAPVRWLYLAVTDAMFE